MKKLFFLFFISSPFLFAQNIRNLDSAFVRNNYTKFEYRIPMRDGVNLFTQVYVPKDASPANLYPMLMQRTCYSIAPYGLDNYSKSLFYSRNMMYEKYIFVDQDVRGRYMSEGEWTNMTPQKTIKKSNKDVDESTDTYDTIDWLVKNINNTNGKVGMYGISYPGFYSAAGALSGHPALVAVSPQAPVSDFFFEDFHHNGAFTLGYGLTFPVFGLQHSQPTTSDWFSNSYPKIAIKDGFDWYKKQTPLSEFGKNYPDNFFWKEHVDHPNYDEFWQSRSIIPHLKDKKNMPAMMMVGGWFDAEDVLGPLNIYKTLEKSNGGSYNTLVMGPFGHGEWASETGNHMHSNIYFGDSISTFYQRQIEIKFFNHFLKGKGDGNTGLPEAYLFDTGKKEWMKYAKWPISTAKKVKYYFNSEGQLTTSKSLGFSEYLSDPNKPVPYTENNKQVLGFTPRAYMSEDQRFAGRRPDVLVFETPVLENNVTIGGEIMAKLLVATTQTDADWFVKLIDVYPENLPNTPYTPSAVVLGGYQQMVRSEIMRSRFRNSFSKPEPMIANQPTKIDFRLQDVLHTFKKGHKIMVQVQSTAFPLFDINPQKYVPNIYKAQKSDFKKAIHKVYAESYLEVEILE